MDSPRDDAYPMGKRTRYEINKDGIKRYMSKRPDALIKTQTKYFQKPEIKEKLKEYNKEYSIWNKYLNNDIYLYEKKKFLAILL
jgi:hypothetical protein